MGTEGEDRNNERFVNLTAAQKVTDDHLNKIDETLDALDKVLRGDYENDQHGLVSRIEDVERTTRKLHAVVFQDEAGTKGLVHTVNALVTGELSAVDRRKNHSSIIIAVITSTALVLTNLDRIGSFWTMLFGEKKVVEKQRKKHAKRAVKVIPEEPEETE